MSSFDARATSGMLNFLVNIGECALNVNTLNFYGERERKASSRLTFNEKSLFGVMLFARKICNKGQRGRTRVKL